MATKVILGENLEKQGITCMYPQEKTRWYVKVPAFSFSKLQGMDAYLSPEMKSTGEAIGYDKKLHRAMYKAMIASGIRVQNYGTVIVTLADEDKEEAVPLIRRFYDMGFNRSNFINSRDSETSWNPYKSSEKAVGGQPGNLRCHKRRICQLCD